MERQARVSSPDVTVALKPRYGRPPTHSLQYLPRILGKVTENHTPAVGRQDAFLDSLRIVKEWLDHDSVRCDDIAGMAADDKVPQQIADACRHDANDVGIQPIFADEIIPESGLAQLGR